MEATATPPARTPRPVTIMGAGEEILDLESLKKFHTPVPSDRGERNYHQHNNLTSHYKFAKAVINGCQLHGIHIEDISFKVDAVQETSIPLKINGMPLMGSKRVNIANRFFLIARIKNKEMQLADDVETYIIARNSHDKRIPMELAIGNQVIICSNLMFGGDIHVKSKNTRFGFDRFHDFMNELFKEYLNNVATLTEDIAFFKAAKIIPVKAHTFIGKNASNGLYIQPGRIHRVHAMFDKPEHREYYQTQLDDYKAPEIEAVENYTLWRLLNAYTYVHRGDLAIDKETKEPYEIGHARYEERTNSTSLQLKKKYTAALWDKLKTAETNWDWFETTEDDAEPMQGTPVQSMNAPL